MGGQEIAERPERTPAEMLVAQVRGETFKQEVALALPPDVAPERFIRATVTALLDNPDLATKAEQSTVFQALLKSAQDGLLPDSREAAIVIFKGKAQYLPMIGGLRKIAAEHGWAISSAVVYEHDEYDHVLAPEAQINH